ncbi:DUF6223 family protein [Streptomyces sp. NPDC058734]|uniref:DUF6223 family protein n=1 Tax=Streptomyces sp. NPDC058734 TaxID=3346615 RepID=UPI0036BE1279
MPTRRLIATATTTAAAAVIAGIGLAAPAAAHTAAQSAAETVYGPTFDRIWAGAAALLALAAVVVGRLALTRSTRRSGTGDGRREAITALAAGPITLVNGGLVLATADGGPGTGNGVVAGAAALVLGLAATILGGLARARSRRTG